MPARIISNRHANEEENYNPLNLQHFLLGVSRGARKCPTWICNHCICICRFCATFYSPYYFSLMKQIGPTKLQGLSNLNSSNCSLFSLSWTRVLHGLKFDGPRGGHLFKKLNCYYNPYSLIRYWRVLMDIPRIFAALFRFPPTSERIFRMVSRSRVFSNPSAGGEVSLGLSRFR